jgi:hypothetical protein
VLPEVQQSLQVKRRRRHVNMSCGWISPLSILAPYYGTCPSMYMQITSHNSTWHMKWNNNTARSADRLVTDPPPVMRPCVLQVPTPGAASGAHAGPPKQRS